ncbi:MAG: fatty acid desaturase [Lentisphaeraceae bacterium]|nr:fatty acid desaturase [Lentisphaeraceae bacterium]
MEITTPPKKINWLNSIVLITTPIAAAILVPYYWINTGYNWMDWTFFGIFMVCSGLGITGGYHRLWSHKSYDAHPLVRFFYAYWGGCAIQNTILDWSADHRNHHKHVDDNEKDPYSARKGFWWSHMGWILVDSYKGEDPYANVKDLQKDKIVMWQFKYYLHLIVFSNIIVPILLGMLAYKVTGVGSIWGTLILAGLFRFVLNSHFTFFINSACHFFGAQPYSNKDTSRDNFILALVTYGEGYHNFHHTFQADYRNGIRWYHFDPTKWLVKGLSYIGMTSNLKKVSESLIQKQMMLHAVTKKKESFLKRNNLKSSGCQVSQKVETLYTEFTQSLNDWLETSQTYLRSLKNKKLSQAEIEALKSKIDDLKHAIEAKKTQLLEYFKTYSQQPAVA